MLSTPLFLAKANVFDNPRVSTGIPKWAWQFKPPIPLVGRNYRPGKRLLIASVARLSRPKKSPKSMQISEEFSFLGPEPHVLWTMLSAKADKDIS